MLRCCTQFSPAHGQPRRSGNSTAAADLPHFDSAEWPLLVLCFSRDARCRAAEFITTPLLISSLALYCRQAEPRLRKMRRPISPAFNFTAQRHYEFISPLAACPQYAATAFHAFSDIGHGDLAEGLSMMNSAHSR